MNRLHIGHTSLAYTEHGQGEPLVLVHGSASDWRTWEPQREEFGRRFRTITYSRRYHWPNEPIPDGVDYSMAEQIADLEALLRALGASPAHLVGHSYGAVLCLLLAVNRPELVHTLVLAEPPVIALFVSNAPRPPELLRILLTRPRTAAALIRFAVKGVAPASKAFRRNNLELGARIFGNAVFGPEGFTRLPEARKTQVRDNLPNIKAELLGSGSAPLHEESLRGVQAPVLLIEGQRSISLFHRLTDRLHELLPTARRIEIHGASHLMHEENPREFNDAVLAFLP